MKVEVHVADAQPGDRVRAVWSSGAVLEGPLVSVPGGLCVEGLGRYLSTLVTSARLVDVSRVVPDVEGLGAVVRAAGELFVRTGTDSTRCPWTCVADGSRWSVDALGPDAEVLSEGWSQ